MARPTKRANARSQPERASGVPALGRRSSPEERRAQIIAVAEELFRSVPYSQLGVADVAKAAGITQGLVYHYYPSKEALFVAAFELRASELLRFCLPDVTLPLQEQAELGVRGYLDFVDAHDMAYLNLFRGPASTEVEFQRVCEQTRAAIVEHFVAALGLTRRKLPATRLSMRGYLGYAEAVILDWLEHRQVSRSVIERMMHSIIVAALQAGLLSDRSMGLSPSDLETVVRSYREHFGLP
ncbi:MAG TPA: TetR/AcrR family transcriptional regulator [Polyangiales bacterium]